jgi:uncharacterized protein (TIGR03083 family)
MVLDDLDITWQAWVSTGAALSADQWRLPTRLPGWTVKDVYAHHGVFPHWLAKMAAAPAVDGPLTHPDAAALLRDFNAPGGAAHVLADKVRAGAVEYATEHPAEQLVADFAAAAPQAIAAAREVPLDRVIAYGRHAVIPLREAARMALMEAVVHYLDIARAAGLPVPGPLDGGPLRATAELLTAVADPVEVIEHATGRTGADPFPVVR